jgi:outer membrane protein assembly factor BamB
MSVKRLVFLAWFAAAATAQERVVLRDGIVVDPRRDVAYVMTPEGIAAVDLATGAPLWTTTAADKPLALVGDRLLTQIEPETSENRDDLLLAALNVVQRGAVIARAEADLPDAVRTAVTATLEGRLFVRAERASATTATLAWEFVPSRRPLRGAGPGPRAEKRLDGVAAGEVRMNLVSGAIRLAADLPDGRALREREWRIAARRYRGAGGTHVVASERVADDRVWDKYLWTISEAESGRVVGTIRTHVAFSPFVVRKGVIVFETTPYVRGDDVQPAKLRGFSLETGREVWSFEVREVVFRGTLPP